MLMPSVTSSTASSACTREEAPLVQADDAAELVTDGMSIEAVIDALVGQFRSRVAEEAWPTPAG